MIPFSVGVVAASGRDTGPDEVENYDAVIAELGPQALWYMALEDDNVTLVDVISGNDLTVSGTFGATYEADQNLTLGDIIVFSGASAVSGNALPWSGTGKTIEGVLQIRTGYSQSGNQTVMGLGDAGRSIRYQPYPADGKHRAICYDGSNGTVLSDEDYQLDRWVHVLVVLDTESNLIEMFINGASKGEATTNPGGIQEPFYLLNNPWNQDIQQGPIAFRNLAAYPYALSADQALRLYQAFQHLLNTTPYNALILSDEPVAYWKLDDLGEQFVDSIGVHHASPGNSPAVEQAPLVVGGYSVSFSGSGYANVLDDIAGGHAFTSIGSETGFTVEFWMTAKSGSTASNGSSSWRCAETAIELREAGVANQHIPFNVGQDGGVACFKMAPQGGSSVQTLSGSVPTNDGARHHIVAVCDGTDIYLYVDGDLDVSVPLASGQNTAVGASPCYFNIAARATDNGSKAGYFGGVLDEIAIYDYPLSASIIGEHYAVGSAD